MAGEIARAVTITMIKDVNSGVFIWNLSEYHIKDTAQLWRIHEEPVAITYS